MNHKDGENRKAGFMWKLFSCVFIYNCIAIFVVCIVLELRLRLLQQKKVENDLVGSSAAIRIRRSPVQAQLGAQLGLGT